MDKSIMTNEEASVYHNISNIQLEDGLNLIDNLSPQSSDSVLDMGCGTGRLCMVLSERLSDGGKVLGIDPDEERINVANKGRKDTMTNLRFAVGSDQTFPEDQYDAIISSQVIHWIKNKDATFKRVYENLKPGGKFAFATITNNGIPDLLVELVKLCGSDAFDAVMSCSHYESLDFYKQKAKEYGFSVVRIQSIDRECVLPNIDTFINFYFSAYHGRFDRTNPNLNGFREKYSGQAIKWTIKLLFMVLAKPSTTE
uniref:Methyltransferase domain-containing protein n=1 Tax=Amphimedon queenslandica TaxID=400682 RepID=A0A1X7TQI1_AMPQE